MIVDTESVSGYDVIGDVHGCARSLIALLKKMGYQKKAGVWSHPERKAVFVGDIIDRGPHIREAMTMVRGMVEAGSAYLTLGNHEYNAIVYSTLPDQPVTETLARRYRRLGFHLRQTLVDYRHYLVEWQDTVNWLRRQQLSLEFPNFRVVHACWDQDRVDFVRRHFNGCPLASNGFVMDSLQPGLEPHIIVERLLKGTDMILPEGHSIVGSDGVERDRFRTSFWSKAPETYGDVLFQPDKLPESLMQKPLTGKERKRLLTYAEEEKPLFVGHYWCKGQPKIINHNIACLDYSAVKNGLLVAYRINTENRLTNDSFIWVDNSFFNSFFNPRHT